MKKEEKMNKRPAKKKAPINWHLLRWRIGYWIRSPFRIIGDFLARVFTIYRVAVLLVLVAVALFYYNNIDFTSLIPNIITDLLGVALAVFIIDTMYRLRSNAERKKVLIAKLGSKNHAVATEALHELNAGGWLLDGSLERAFLLSCNLDGNSFTGANLQRASFSFGSLRDTTWFEADLQGAFLDHADLSDSTLSMPADIPHHHAEADLTGASLFSTNLNGAKVRDEQLCRVQSLWRATMPNGLVYDGRYNLFDDIGRFLKYARDPNDPKAWADYYGVSIAQYLDGQKWASMNLDRVRASRLH